MDSLLTKASAEPGRFARTIGILRNYRWRQLALRFSNVLKNRIAGNRVIGNLKDYDSFATHPISQETLGLAKILMEDAELNPNFALCDVGASRFTFLNTTAELQSPNNWDEHLRNQTHLWRFQFHYHEFLL